MLHVARDGVLSQATPLALAPAITSCTASVKPAERRGFTGAVIVALQPQVQPDQGVVLELFPARTSLLDLRRSYRFESPAGDGPRAAGRGCGSRWMGWPAGRTWCASQSMVRPAR